MVSFIGTIIMLAGFSGERWSTADNFGHSITYYGLTTQRVQMSHPMSHSSDFKDFIEYKNIHQNDPFPGVYFLTGIGLCLSVITFICFFLGLTCFNYEHDQSRKPKIPVRPSWFHRTFPPPFRVLLASIFSFFTSLVSIIPVCMFASMIKVLPVTSGHFYHFRFVN